MNKRRILQTLAATALLAAVTLLLACSNDDTSPDATPTAVVTTTTAVVTTTQQTTASTTTATSSSGLAAPTDLRVTGALPDLHTPVPPGQGEQGRITVAWQDNSSNETGFRILQDCNGTVSMLTEVGANETSIGPLQTCRPGRLGVAAFNATAVSDVVWTP